MTLFGGSTLLTRDALLKDRSGFGASTTGGLGGPEVRVTTNADSGPGSLREAASISGPAWITFGGDMTIDLLSAPLVLNPDKTIDGRGRKVSIGGRGIISPTTPGDTNCIVAWVTLGGGTLFSANDDGLRFAQDAPGGRRVWVHHVSFLDVPDEELQLTMIDEVTVSWCRFGPNPGPATLPKQFSNGKGCLITGLSTNIPAMRVSMHHNRYDYVIQRHPRARDSHTHVWNNYISRWGHPLGLGLTLPAINSCFGGSVLAEGNVAKAIGVNEPANPYDHRTVGSSPQTTRHTLAIGPDHSTTPGDIKIVGNLMLNGATQEEQNPENVFVPSYSYDLEPATLDLAERIDILAGNVWRKN